MLRTVFVHLGKAPADHLWLNLKRHQELFPKQPVHVILNDSSHALNAQALRIPITYYQPSVHQNDLLQTLSHESEFRQGFWRFTLERIFALETFHDQYPDDSILHVESDVLLMPNFPFLEFEQSKKMAWTNYNSERDVSAILFSPDKEETSWLVRQIEEQLSADKSLTDMTTLARIRMANLDRVSKLPGIRESLENRNQTCFDSAVIGMWLCGEDPRNHYGSLRIHNNSEYLSGSINFDPSQYIYSFTPEFGLQIEFNSQKVSIICLHIHSKDLRLFDKDWESYLLDFVKRSKETKQIRMFLLPVLINLLKSNFSQKTFLPFVLGIPPIYKMRMWAREKLHL